MSVIISIVLILVSLVLIVAVLMQEGNKQGLGAISGAADTFLGKNKSKSAEGKLLTITKITAAVFVVIAILATWLNARTYQILFYDEDGNEYFPKLEAQVQYAQFAYQFGMTQEEPTVTYEQLNESIKDVDEKRVALSYNAEINEASYPTPAKEGYVGHWDPALPEKMGSAFFPAIQVGCVLGIFAVCLVLDAIRKYTVGRLERCTLVTALCGRVTHAADKLVSRI